MRERGRSNEEGRPRCGVRCTGHDVIQERSPECNRSFLLRDSIDFWNRQTWRRCFSAAPPPSSISRRCSGMERIHFSDTPGRFVVPIAGYVRGRPDQAFATASSQMDFPDFKARNIWIRDIRPGMAGGAVRAAGRTDRSHTRREGGYNRGVWASNGARFPTIWSRRWMASRQTFAGRSAGRFSTDSRSSSPRRSWTGSGRPAGLPKRG